MQYIGLVLNENSHDLLVNVTTNLINNLDNVSNYKIFCHHMTVAFKTMFDDDILNYLNNNKGNKYRITATHVGMSDKAIALKVETDCPSYNNIKHITLATINDGKPKDSNDITNWIKLYNNINLVGYLEGVD